MSGNGRIPATQLGARACETFHRKKNIWEICNVLLCILIDFLYPQKLLKLPSKNMRKEIFTGKHHKIPTKKCLKDML